MNFTEKKADYQLVCDIEEINLNKKFLPFSIGTPKKTTTSNNHHERANFVFFTDSHVDLFEPLESLDNVKRIIEYSNGCPVKFDALINAGDAITPSNMVPKSEAKERFKKFFDLVKQSRSPVVYAIGNHDSNDSTNVLDNAFTSDDYSEMFFDFAEENYGIIRQTKKDGTKSTWHYRDIEEKKIRIIAVDVYDTDRTVKKDDGTIKFGTKWGNFISQEQFDWISNVALNFDDKAEGDWGVILTLHEYIDNVFKNECDWHQNTGEVLHKILVAFNTQSTYSYTYKHKENSFFDTNVCVDFTRYAQNDKKPHIICCLLGHDHVDKSDVVDGINLIWSLNSSASSLYGDARVMRYVGTSTQNAFDVVNIDTLNRKIRIFRYGASLTCYGVGGDRFLPDGLDY